MAEASGGGLGGEGGSPPPPPRRRAAGGSELGSESGAVERRGGSPGGGGVEGGGARDAGVGEGSAAAPLGEDPAGGTRVTVEVTLPTLGLVGGGTPHARRFAWGKVRRRSRAAR